MWEHRKVGVDVDFKGQRLVIMIQVVHVKKRSNQSLALASVIPMCDIKSQTRLL